MPPCCAEGERLLAACHAAADATVTAWHSADDSNYEADAIFAASADARRAYHAHLASHGGDA